MKKLITILTIMVVLATAVFAVDAGSAVINVTANIEDVLPTIQLRLTASDDVNGATAAIPDGEDTGALKTAGINTLSGGRDLTLAFDIFQSTLARLSANTGHETYTIGIVATDMVLQVNDADKPAAGNNEKFVVTQARPAINALSTQSAVAANYEQAIDLDHPGQTVVTATATGSAAGTGTLGIVYKGYVPASTVLGSFNVAWHGNAAAVPGDYKASVTMTVTTN